MVFVTHDQEEAIILSDYMSIMDKGKLLQIDTPEKIYRDPADPFISEFLGLKDVVWGDDGRVMKTIM